MLNRIKITQNLDELQTYRTTKNEKNLTNFIISFIAADQAWALAKTVSVDKTNCSVSFNEFLTLMSVQQEVEPDHETLVDVFA